jgi:hypothetical protein
MTNPSDPPVPKALLEEAGFSLAERRTETLFDVGTVRIDGVTRRYEDDRSRDALREATDGDLDHPIRFFAVTRVLFRPSLPPGVSLSMFAPTLRSEARASFADQLEDRGVTNVRRGSSRRLRLDGGRARVRNYSGRDPMGGDGRSLVLSFRLSVLTYRQTALVVTAGFPAVPVAEQFGLADSPAILTRDSDDYQAEFESLLDGVYDEVTT